MPASFSARAIRATELGIVRHGAGHPVRLGAARERGTSSRLTRPCRCRPGGTRIPKDLADPADVSLGHRDVQRWNLPDGWVISRRPAHAALVSEAGYIAAQDISAARGPSPRGDPAGPARRRYLLAGLLACGVCGRRMESAWSNGKAAYRCRHGRTTASAPDPGRPKRAHVREHIIVAHLPALHLLLTGTEGSQGRGRRRTRRGIDVRYQATAEDVIAYLREQQVTLTYDPAARTLHAGTGNAATTITLKAS